MKNTKKSLLVSVLSLMLCVAMLLGTTYAWFTDSVTSGKNTITAGNLDVELKHTNAKVTTPTTVENATDLFNVAKWEPGVIAYENFTVENVGDLALKYTMVLSRWNFNTVQGTDKSLADVIKVAVVPGGYTATTREDLLADSTITFNSLLTEGTNDLYKIQPGEDNGILYPANSKPEDGKSSETFGVILYWAPSDNDNDYNLNNGKQSSDGKPLFLELGVNLVATQYTHEADSFDNQYDKDTVLPVIGTNTQVSQKAADGTYVFENEKYVEGGVQKQAPATVIPASTTFYSAHEKTDSDKIPEASGDNVSGELNRKVVTSKEVEDELTTIDLDISFTYTTKTNGVVTDTQDVKAFSNVIEYSAPVGDSFIVKAVTHNGVPMTPATDITTKADQTYYYDLRSGILYVWSSTFSVFEMQGIYAVARIDTQDVSKLYRSLQDAIDETESVFLSDDIKLLRDITLDNGYEDIKVSRNATVDLQQHTLSASYDLDVKTPSTDTLFTFKNGNISLNAGKIFYIYTGGNVTLENVDVNRKIQAQSSKLTIQSGTYHESVGDVSGYAGSVVTIHGGTFLENTLSTNVSTSNKATTVIDGGDFAYESSIKWYVAEGYGYYRLKDTGMYRVVPEAEIPKVAEYGETQYGNFQDAFNAFKNGTKTGTIKLLDDVAYTGTLSIAAEKGVNYDLTIDLNSHTMVLEKPQYNNAISLENKYDFPDGIFTAKLTVTDNSTTKTGKLILDKYADSSRVWINMSSGGYLTLKDITVSVAGGMSSGSNSPAMIGTFTNSGTPTLDYNKVKIAYITITNCSVSNPYGAIVSNENPNYVVGSYTNSTFSENGVDATSKYIPQS